MRSNGAGTSDDTTDTAQQEEAKTGDRFAPVAATKVRIPATAENVLVRERLHLLIDAAVAPTEVGPSVTLVCAPAGAGKTTMLATWARQRVSRTATRVAWVSVDTEDDDPERFWSAVCQALESTGVWSGRDPVPTAQDPYPVVLTALVEALEQAAEPVVLVLDGVHDLRSDKTSRTVNFLLRHAPCLLPVVLVARFPPPLILPRLRLEGRLREIGPDDLVFTPTEAHLLYVREGVELSGKELSLLMERTEGWAAGLRLAALTLGAADSAGERITAFGGDEHVVADYLIGEVVARQPTEVQDFMFATCVCPTFTAQLAAELSEQENAGQIIDWLERSGVVVSRKDGDGRSYRYHPLLRGYLRAELGRREMSALRERHRTVAGWYLDTGDELRAIEHAAASGDDDLVTRLVAKFGLAQVLDGQARRLRRVLDSVRPHILARPSVALVAAATALDLADVPVTDRFLRSVDNAAHPLRTQRLRALHATVHLQRHRLDGEVADALAALRATRAGQTGDVDVDLLALVNRGVAAAWLGRHRAAVLDLRRALSLAETEGRDGVRLQCETHLAALAGAEGDLAGMGAHARTALAVAERRAWAGTSRCSYAYTLLGIEAYERLEHDRARKLAAVADELADGPVDPTIELLSHTLAAMVDFEDAGNPHEVVALARSHWQRLSGKAVPPVLIAYTAPIHQRMALLVGEWLWAAEVLDNVRGLLGESGESVLLHAILHAHKGKVGPTRRLLKPVLDGEARTFSPSTTVHAWLLEAHLADRCEESHRAHQALTEALTMAAPHGAMRVFRDAGQSVRALLAGGAGRFGRLDQFAAEVLSRLPSSVPDPTEGLTEREQALLAELPSMRTAEEIAHTMFVSVNTVKTHLRGIYRKLGVSHRRDAITVARRRGLL